MDAGFFRGTSSEQDGRFSDKEKKLMKQMKFEPQLETKINLERVNLDVIKPWITMRINEILGMEDDVVIEYILTQLESDKLNPKLMQINITGFLNARRAREFMGELWNLFIEATQSEDGIPKTLVDKKLSEMRKDADGNKAVVKAAAESDWTNRYVTLSGGRYSGPTVEKDVRDDRIPERALSPRRGPPTRRGISPSPPPPAKQLEKTESREREKNRERRHDEDKRREDESRRREEERLKRRAEEKEREKRRDEDRNKNRERRREVDRDRGDRDRGDRDRDRIRSRSRSPPRRRFIENVERKSRRDDSDVEKDRKKREKEREREKEKVKERKRDDSGDSDSESDHARRKREKKEKKAKKHKKEKKKKERKRSPSASETDSI